MKRPPARCEVDDRRAQHSLAVLAARVDAHGAPDLHDPARLVNMAVQANRRLVALDDRAHRGRPGVDLLADQGPGRVDGRVELCAHVQARAERRHVQVEYRPLRVGQLARHLLQAAGEFLLADVARARPRRRVPVSARDHLDSRRDLQHLAVGVDRVARAVEHRLDREVVVVPAGDIQRYAQRLEALRAQREPLFHLEQRLGLEPPGHRITVAEQLGVLLLRHHNRILAKVAYLPDHGLQLILVGGDLLPAEHLGAPAARLLDHGGEPLAGQVPADHGDISLVDRDRVEELAQHDVAGVEVRGVEQPPAPFGGPPRAAPGPQPHGGLLGRHIPERQ